MEEMPVWLITHYLLIFVAWVAYASQEVERDLRINKTDARAQEFKTSLTLCKGS